MPETTDIRVANLRFDELNPRLYEPNAGQREAFRAIAENQQRKLVRLAKDIVEHGINTRPIVYY